MTGVSGARAEFKISVEGREHDVTTQPGEHGATLVTVDGVTYEVRAAPDDSVLVRALDDDNNNNNSSNSSSSSSSSSSSDSRSSAPAQRRVTLDGRAPLAHVAIAGRGIAVTVKSAREAALERALAERSGAGSGTSRIEAPMPGRVVRVLVAEGDRVEEGAPVLIVEAMKMENELHAPVSGVVSSLRVAEGDTVDSGQLLCELDSQADAQQPVQKDT